MDLRLKFLGGAGTVTGSKFLLSRRQGLRRHHTLIDCGLFQGLKELRLRNRAEPPFDPRRVDEILLTHAHLDHSGYLPLVVKRGYRGPIFCSEPTRDLLKLVLLDSARIQEEDAEFANKKGFSRHHPALPLYTTEDAEEALRRIETVKAGDWIRRQGRGLEFRFTPSGHILGGVFIELAVGGKRIVFSGDLGRTKPLLFDPPTALHDADHVIIESTYGDRLHPERDPSDEIREAVMKAVESHGQILVPAFAIGRTQELIHLLAELKHQSLIPTLPVYLDSPMGIRATEIFMRHASWHRLSSQQIERMEALVTPTHSREESIEIMRRDAPAIVIAGSGMATGGRILHHLEARLPDPRHTVLLTGFQAAGTRGRSLEDGAPEIKLHGRYVAARAQVRRIEGLSAHADQREILAWLEGFRERKPRISIVHGEPCAADALRVKIHERFGIDAGIPCDGAEVTL